MMIMNDQVKRVEMPGVAGVGPAAWNCDKTTSAVAIPRRNHRRNVVSIDHEERKRALEQLPANRRMTNRRLVESRDPYSTYWTKLSILAPLITLIALSAAIWS